MMLRTESSTISRELHRPVFLSMLALQGVALGITAYLLWIALGEGASPAGCAGNAIVDCDHVLASRWSRVAGLPVALPALFVYLSMLVATCVAGCSSRPLWRRRAWWIAMTLAAGAAGAAAWFIALQLALLGSVCLFCLAVHVCGLLLMVLIGGSTFFGAWRDARPIDARSADRLAPVHAVMLGLAGVAVLVALQVVLRPRQYVVSGADDLPPLPSVSPETEPHMAGSAPAHARSPDVLQTPTVADRASKEDAAGDETPPPGEPATSNAVSRSEGAETDADSTADARTITMLDGKLTLRPSEHLLLGPTSADWFIVELFDYTCSKCRQMHAHLEAARHRYGDRLAIVLIPVPLNSGCNPTVHNTQPVHENACLYARLAMAVWKNNPDAFPDFHQWLFETVQPPPPGIARSRASSLLGGRNLFEESNSKWVRKQLDRCIEISRRLGAASVPKLIVGPRIISGSTEDCDEFFELIESNLKARPADQQSRSRKRHPVR